MNTMTAEEKEFNRTLISKIFQRADGIAGIVYEGPSGHGWGDGRCTVVVSERTLEYHAPSPYGKIRIDLGSGYAHVLLTSRLLADVEKALCQGRLFERS